MNNRPHRDRRAAPQSFLFYVPIVLVIGLGYLAGAALAFGVQFLNLLPCVQGYLSRLTIMLFGCGMLGATLSATRWWALDIDEAFERPEFLPHALDWFGYATTIVGGGITGVILYLGIRAGIFLTVSGEHISAVRLPVAIVLSFSGGLYQFKVQEQLDGIVRVIRSQREGTRDLANTNQVTNHSPGEVDREPSPEATSQESYPGGTPPDTKSTI